MTVTLSLWIVAMAIALCIRVVLGLVNTAVRK